MFRKKKTIEKKPNYKINWYEDKYQSVLVWRNWLFVITILSLIGVTAVCGALFFMLPLKGVAPFVIQVDEKSGMSEVVTNKTVKEYSANEMLVKFFTMQYISARETYDLNSFRNNMEIVRVMSSSDVNWAYNISINKDNPTSPLNRFAEHTNRYVELLSFSVLSKNEASDENIVQARLRVREIRSNAAPVEYYSVVTISCYFEKKLELNEKERLINPLGFTVTSYKADEEIQGSTK